MSGRGGSAGEDARGCGAGGRAPARGGERPLPATDARELPDVASRGAVGTAPVILEPENAAVVRPLAQIADGASSLSVTWVALGGRHRELRSDRSARWYFVLSGELRFVLAGSAAVVLRAEDWLTIPRGCRYFLEGNGTYLVANAPAFEPGDDVYGEP